MSAYQAAMDDAKSALSAAASHCRSLASRVTPTTGLAALVAGLLAAKWVKATYFRPKSAPPRAPCTIPLLGNIVEFGERPVDFLYSCYKKYGPVFSITMFGTEVTYLLGSEASANFWSSSNDDLNSEDLYANITVPVFGEGIVFDVPHKVFLEQKTGVKAGLSQARFEKYTSWIEKECFQYLERWDKDQGTANLHASMAEMIIFTATRCLHGKETRDAFDEAVAGLYHDLDGGFSPLAWFFPRWVPFPSFQARDRAHRELKRRFHKVIAQRQASGQLEGHDDLLETLTTFRYSPEINGGRKLTNDEIAGLMIALLMAGQHTSSTTSTWCAFFIASVPGLQEELYQEQLRVLGPNPQVGALTLAQVEQMKLLHSCVREALRLRPPIMQMMRKARKDYSVTVGGKTYVIPKGNQVCVSPSLNGKLDEAWDTPDIFDPRRFLDTSRPGEPVVTQGEQYPQGGKFKWVPFGAGRHRCIGFEFAQIQVRCVLSAVIRTFTLELPEGKVPAVNYRTMIHTPLNPTIIYKRRQKA